MHSRIGVYRGYIRLSVGQKEVSKTSNGSSMLPGRVSGAVWWPDHNLLNSKPENSVAEKVDAESYAVILGM